MAEVFGDGEYDVGGSDVLVHDAGDLVADDLGEDHGDGLAKHHRLGLDPSHAPPQHSEPVYHGGVRVCAKQSKSSYTTVLELEGCFYTKLLIISKFMQEIDVEQARGSAVQKKREWVRTMEE